MKLRYFARCREERNCDIPGVQRQRRRPLTIKEASSKTRLRRVVWKQHLPAKARKIHDAGDTQIADGRQFFGNTDAGRKGALP